MYKIKKLEEISLEEINSFGTTLYSSEYMYEIKRRKSGSQINFKMNLVKNQEDYVKYIDNDLVTLEDYNSIIIHGFSMGAFKENKLIGFLIAEEMTWNNSVRVEMVRVADDHKGNGIGTSLLSALENSCRNRGVRIIEIETQNTNIPAINFYKKNGYELAGLNMTMYDPEECKDEIAVFMSKVIIYSATAEN